MRSLTCFSSGCCFLPSVKESQSSVCWSAESCQLLPCDQESVLVQCFWKSEWLILFMLFNVISNKKAVRFRFFFVVVVFFHPCETKSLTYLVYLHYFVCHRISEANCDVGFQTPRAECCALGGLAGLGAVSPGVPTSHETQQALLQHRAAEKWQQEPLWDGKAERKEETQDWLHIHAAVFLGTHRRVS